MKSSEEIKSLVKEKYGAIASMNKESAEACCGTACCGGDTNIMADSYENLAGYNPDADLGLGCGLPTQFARIKKGDVVVDLGSGAGNDCFVARSETGETGKIIGIDMTTEMIQRARINAEKLQFNNVEFRQGEIEDMPVSTETVDVVVSNCVLNLVPDKEKAFDEIKRILKPGGHFSISDIVLSGELPDKIREAATFYAGCVSGALQKEEYMNIIKSKGFTNIEVQKEKSIYLPDELMEEYLTKDELQAFRNSGLGIFSITVYAEKSKDDCCDKSTCCN